MKLFLNFRTYPAPRLYSKTRKLLWFFKDLWYFYVSFNKHCGNCKCSKANPFYQHNRSIKHIPPTCDVLLNHLKRAILQCFVWRNCLQRDAEQPNPGERGWKKVGDQFEPLWSTSSDISMEKLQELIACKCTQRCISKCRCVKSTLRCTMLCRCEGQCTRE